MIRPSTRAVTGDPLSIDRFGGLANEVALTGLAVKDSSYAKPGPSYPSAIEGAPSTRAAAKETTSRIHILPALAETRNSPSPNRMAQKVPTLSRAVRQAVAESERQRRSPGDRSTPAL